MWYRRCSVLLNLRHRFNHVKRSMSSTVSKGEPKQVIFSGVQPTGYLHIGNYFGAIKNWVEMQNDPDKKCIFSIVDLHSITLKQEPDVLRSNMYEMLACLLACGVDPSKSILFKQSDVSEHAQLYWMLSCISGLNRLQKFPQFKEKTEGLKEIPIGFLAYPVLQAADILLYKATYVPVGEDQVAHINLCADLAIKFNAKIANVFPIPKAVLSENSNAIRIRSLRIPDKKMSKSEPTPKGRIEIVDSPEDIKEKFKKAVTDMIPEISFDLQNRAAVSNLILIHSLFSGKSPDQIVKDSQGLTTAQYKLLVADIVIESLTPIREETLRLSKDQGYLDQIFHEGQQRASEIASQTLQEVRQALGMTSGNPNRLEHLLNRAKV